MEVDEAFKCQVDEEQRNINKIRCKFCSSLVLLPQTGLLTDEIEILLPKLDGENEPEKVNKFWKVNDIFEFENMTFSKTVEQYKYLSCCDCEVGPIGFHDQNSKLSFLCLDRVKYET